MRVASPPEPAASDAPASPIVADGHPSASDELDAVGREAEPPIEERTPGLIAPAPSARAPSFGVARARKLSPNLIALYGTLIGLATVAALTAIAIQLDSTPRASLPPPAPAPSAAVPSPSAPAPVASVRVEQPVKIPGPWRVSDLAGDGEYRIVKGTVGRDPFLKVLQAAGLDKNQAYAALGALKGLVNLDHCDPRDEFVAAVKRSTKQLAAFEYVAGKEDIYQARAGSDGALSGKKLDLHVERARRALAFGYDGRSLDDSARAAGFGEGIYKVLAAALGRHLDLEAFERGDVLRVIVQEVRVLGEFARYAGIEAVEYRPIKGEPARFYSFRDSHGTLSFYDRDGKAPYEGGWRFPIPGGHVTSPYNLHRMHPILHKIMPHLGTDIGAPIGTPVHASSFGVVERMSGSGATGNLVMLQHAGGVETGYAHLVRFAEGLKVGDHVKRMQVIGYVGSTGRSTGPHLHWIAKRDGEFFDAMKLDPDALRVLPSDERTAFAAAKAKFDAELDAIALPAPLSGPAPAAATASAAAANVAIAPPAAEEGDTEDQSGHAAAAASSAPPSGKKNPIYMTDQELLQAQPRSDDGEVER